MPDFATAPLPRMTLAEFLESESEFEGDGDTRYQLIDGRPVAMAPPREGHGTICANLSGALRLRLKGPCRPVTDPGIVFPDRGDLYYVADVAVTCAPPDPTRVWVKDPILIVEVECPSSCQSDAGKALEYADVPSVAEVLLISTDARRVRLLSRQLDGTWLMTDVIGEASVPLHCLGGSIPLAEIYRDSGL